MFHSIEEQNALDQFRRALMLNDLVKKTDDDHYLLRWLRARDLNVEKAKDMLLHNLEWRENHPELENISNWIPSNEVLDDITYKFTGLDRFGHPVLYMPIGSWCLRKLIEAGLKEEIFHYFYKIMQEILVRIEEVTKSNGKTEIVAVFDVAGLTVSKLASIETVQATTRFFREFESYYPEILHTIYVINTHWVFYYGFKMVKHIISANTIAKIQILTNKSSWQPVLTRVMSSDTIPEEYGGTGEPIRKLTKS